jgi:hypothetical protein
MKEHVLSINDETFSALKSDFDTALEGVVFTMKEKSVALAEMTIRLKIILEQAQLPDLIEGDGATRMATVPKFEHKITSVMQLKDVRSGMMAGEYELVWDGDDAQYKLRAIDNGQVSLFDKG